jgi:uncharacterized lipoprotein YddW (UPF0748 family)
MRVRAIALSLAGSAILLAGCHSGPRLGSPVRAVWVTRSDYRTADDIRQIMENCAAAGFNHVVFQVRGNGTVFYPSRIEPWAEQFDFKSPGYDPLAVACKEAHCRRLKLHAWVNVMPGWKGTSPPACRQQLYYTHPEWFWYDQQGRRQPLTSFYVSLNPCLPEVRSYLVSVFREIVANYEIDGLHMDYIRFPNEPPAVPENSGIDYPRDARTLALYKQDTWLSPGTDQGSWNRWRTRQVTRLVKDIHAMIRDTRPRVVLSASVGANPRQSLTHFRDELDWVRWGMIDAAFPMNYKPDIKQFDQGLTAWMPYRGWVDVVPGLWFDGKLSTEQGISVVRQQIAASREKTGNFCVFSYASLFDVPEARQAQEVSSTEHAGRRQRGAQQRETRRRALLPYLRSLSAPASPAKVTMLDADARSLP